MRRLRKLNSALLILLALAAPSAFSQCQDTETAAMTTKAVETAISESEVSLQRDFTSARGALAEKARDLSWSFERTNDFLKGVQESREFMAIHSQVERGAMAARRVIHEAESPQVKNDPLKTCEFAIRLRAMMLETEQLSRQELSLITQRIAAIK